MQPTPGRNRRPALVGLSLLGLLGIVAVASRSGFGHGGSQAPSRTFVNYAFSGFLVLFVVAIPVAVYAYVLSAREVELRPRKRFEVRVAAAVLGILLVFALLVVRLYLMHRPIGLFHVHNPGSGSAARGHGHGQTSAYSPAFEWPVLAAFALLAAAAAAAVLRRRGATTPETAAVDPVTQDVAVTIGDAIDDLEREPDARRAVIAAYARMEGVLARHGLQRQPSETALEYLRRALLGLTTSGAAVQRLTGLFERAKFSPHDVDPAMKADAIESLREIRDGLVP
jgi:hypothetical protein